MIEALLIKTIAPLVGTGIGKKFPWAHRALKTIFKTDKTFKTTIPLGLKFLVPADSGPGLFLRATGKYEQLETNLFVACVKPDDIVFDIGAHTGYYALIAGTRGKKVYSFEPEKKNFALLRQNIALNRLCNCIVIPKAVGMKSGRASLFLSDTSSGDHGLSRSVGSKSMVVEVTTIDEVAKKAQPTILKIDVEGAEADVLKGAVKTLTKPALKTIFIEVSANTATSITKMLSSAGFELFLIDELNQKLLLLTASLVRQLINRHSYVNLLALR